MAVNIVQAPFGLSLSQSPMIYTVTELGDEITSSSYQYICELTYGRGSINYSTEYSSSAQPWEDITTYTLEKYPNQSGVGMFDVSRILNSQFQSLIAFYDPDVLCYQAKFYGRWKEGNTFVTSSTYVGDYTNLALNGWLRPFDSIYNNNMNSIVNRFFPLLTDGPVTQSFNDDQYGRSIINVISLPQWNENAPTADVQAIRYESNLGGVDYPLLSESSSFDVIQQVPISPRYLPAPLGPSNPNLEWFTVQAKNVDLDTLVGTPIRFEKKCETKYGNLQVLWKNRWGVFSYFNFDMVSKKSFQTQTKNYKRQLGQWEAPLMDGFHMEPTNQNFMTDVKQLITVNSDWVHEDYNKTFQEMLVSEELYFFIIGDTFSGDFYPNQTIPITIVNSTFQEKTQDVDKLIQYSFTFEYATDYKLQF